MFPLCRELESSGRGDRPFPDRPRGGGHAPQVEGPGWGEHPGSGGGGSQGHGWDEGTPSSGGIPAGVTRRLGAPAGGWEALCSGEGGGRLRRMGWPARRLLGVFPANSWLTPQQLGRERIPQPRQPPGAGTAGRDHGSAWLGTAWHGTSVTRQASARHGAVRTQPPPCLVPTATLCPRERPSTAVLGPHPQPTRPRMGPTPAGRVIASGLEPRTHHGPERGCPHSTRDKTQHIFPCSQEATKHPRTPQFCSFCFPLRLFIGNF